MKLKNITPLLLMAISFASCKKDDDGSTTVNNQPLVTLNPIEQKLVGSWKIVKAMTYEQGTRDSTNEMKDCLKDDVFTFKSDKTYDASLGSDDCGSIGYYMTAQTKDIEWEVLSDSTFAFDHWYRYAGVGIGPKIIEITDSKLVLSQRYKAVSSYESIHTYIRQ